MFKFWKRSKRPQKPEVEIETVNPFLNAILSNSVERRRYARVRYTPVGAVGDLPSVSWKGHSVEVANLSQGGLLLLSPPMESAQPGQEYKFRLHWPHRGLELWNDAKLLRVQRSHWHFQFLRTDARFTEQLPSLVKTGTRAQATHHARENEIPSGENIVELWMSERGDFVLFQRPPETPRELITLCYDNARYRFDVDLGLVTFNRHGKAFEQNPVPASTVDTILIFVSNLDSPTPRIQKLILGLVDRYYRALMKNVS